MHGEKRRRDRVERQLRVQFSAPRILAADRPALGPKPRSNPRRLFSTSSGLDCTGFACRQETPALLRPNVLHCSGRNNASRPSTLATVASRAILPYPSTMRALDRSNDASIRASWSVVAPR